MIDISKGRYWDLPWSLVSSCTRCSDGCKNCWSLAMEKRFHKGIEGIVHTHPERLSIPLKHRKPTVYAVWNDLFHEAVPDEFITRVLESISVCPKHTHTFLILSKRAARMADYFSRIKEASRLEYCGDSMMELDGEYAATHQDRRNDPICLPTDWPLPNLYNGLTVCNQQEWDEKKKYFVMIPGKKFLSIEPMLENIDLGLSKTYKEPFFGWPDSEMQRQAKIDAVILGGETGPGARPMHPDWVRSVRDQCQNAGVPFFFKGWGKWGVNCLNDDNGMIPGSEWMDKGIKHSGRLLDGRTHDDLPWGPK
jgi:protein gp37